tara:strand:+ start:1165 stop:1572 length:408 start_codon:yes stop_codon:yes gene_type:complete
MKTISQLKKHLDNIFSLYIRLRDATPEGLIQCFTCGRISHYKSGMQNGHFQSRRHHSTRWSETNCQVQCVKCNMYEQGEQFRFGLALDSKYGEGSAEELEFLARTIMKVSRIEYEEKISYYKDLVDKLKKEKGIE